jgi:hypothetical protein
VKRTNLALVFGLAMSTALAGGQGSTASADKPAVHYTLVGDASGIHVAIDLESFVLKWFEKYAARFDQMSQAEKDDVAQRLMNEDDLDQVEVRLVNNTDKAIALSPTADTFSVSFKRAQAVYKPASDGSTSYPTELGAGAQTRLRFPVATTIDAKMEIGRLAANLSKIDYLICKALTKHPASSVEEADASKAERPEKWMGPIAQAVLDVDLSGAFHLEEEGITIPLALRISTGKLTPSP